MEPLVSLTILNPTKDLPPGELLRWEYQIDAIKQEELQAIETSVLWYSQGKGEAELGVHFFERLTRGDGEGVDLRVLRKYEIELPNSPLSYDGSLIKIKWCIRVRVFSNQGRAVKHDQPFRLGNFVVPEERAKVLLSSSTCI
jgi:hypothetical protein